MPFFKDLRRRSKASFKTDKSSEGSADGSNDTTKSSSTVNSVYGTSTPASSIPPTGSLSNLSSVKLNGNAMTTPPPPRPSPLTAQSPNKRYSMTGLSTAPSINGGSISKIPISPYAPRVMSISENSWVHQKVLLIYGQIGDPAHRAFDGTLTVNHHQETFPPTSWPVSESHFKAVVHLTPGPNRLRLDFASPKLASANSSIPTHTSTTNINYLPLVNSPPLQLVIIMGKDSPGTFDAVPERVQREGNDLDTAIRKFRMAAYLWQAFTGEQMYRNLFGRRCFRFEEEWQTGSLTYVDRETGQMRNEAKIHVIRSEKTVAELRNLSPGGSNDGMEAGTLFSVAKKAVRAHFKPMRGQKQYVSALLLDSHWDARTKTLSGHTASGCTDDDIHLAIFGSQTLQCYPSSIEEIVPALTDCTRTNTEYVANYCEESGSNWEAVNSGIGAHLHAIGHLFGCPHQESGVMLRDYLRLNRTFLCREPYSTRTREQGMRLVLPKDECGWHRLDTLRFRHHPCFRLPSDPPINYEGAVNVWGVDTNRIVVTAVTGISFIELFAEGDESCHTWYEYVGAEGTPSAGPPRQLVLSETDLRARLPEDRKNRKLRLNIHSVGRGKHIVEDLNQLITKKALVKMPKGQLGFRGNMLGVSQTEGSKPEELILRSSLDQTKLLMAIKVYHGFALEGMEFFYEDSSSQLFGKRGPRGNEFLFDTRRSEILLGFFVRSDLWIDGIEILSSLGRRSGVFGNAVGGTGHTLIPPRGYSLAGISGSSGTWVDGFSLIITR